MLKLTKIIIALLLLVSASFAQSPFLTLMADETVADPYGEELAVNGTFDVDSDWNLQAGWSITGGELVGVGANSSAWQLASVVEGTTYHAVLTVTFPSGVSSVAIFIGGTSSGYINQWETGDGTYEFNIVAGASGTIVISGANGGNVVIDDVSVKEVLNP